MNRAIIVFFLAILSTIFVFWHWHSPAYEGITIAVVQTASHPALDAVKAGFENTIEHALKRSVRFVDFNMQGSVAQAQIIGQQLHNRTDIDGIFAIGTLAAQVLTQIEHEKPICFAAVTDPQSAGIMGSNVCGASDAVSNQQVIALVERVLPDVKKVALLFNISEKNSSIMAERLKQALDNQGYTVTSCAVTSEAELPSAVIHACQHQVIISPIDNMVASTASFIAQRALEAKVPFIVSDISLVEKGALAGVGVDYKQVGVDAAQCLINVLNLNMQPQDIPVVYPSQAHQAINHAVAHQLISHGQHIIIT